MFVARQIFLGRCAKAAAPTAKSYVQDGLIAMWDGIENAGWGVHDANATVWKDLIGGNDATKSGAVLWGDSYADFTPSTTGKFVVGSFLGKPQTFTFEVVVKRLGTRNGPSSPFSSIEAGGAGFQIDRNGTRLFGQTGASSGYYKQVASPYTGTDKTSYSYVFGPTQYLFRNASLEQTAGGGNVVRYNNSYPFLIGCEAGEATWSPMSFNGYVFAVRVCNRALTAAEIAANYAIDKERFNLP